VWTSIGGIANSINPGFPSGKHNKQNKGIPHLRPMNINSKGEIDLTDLKYVESEHYDALMKGDVLFNNTNSPKLLGKTAYIKQDTNWAYSNHMTRIRVTDSLLNAAWVSCCLHTLFLSGYFSMHCVHHVNQASIGSKILSEKVFIPLPPLPEQNRIVAKIEELFTRLDAGVEALKKTKAQLKRYRQAVLKHAFEGKLTEEWRQAHKHELEPASVLLERIKQQRHKTAKNKYKELPQLDTSELTALPEGWVWAQISAIAESMKNGIYKPVSYYSGNGIACLRMYNIENGLIVWKDIKRMNLSKNEISEYELLPGDVLVNRVNSRELVGKAAVIPTGLEPCVYESKNIRLRLYLRYVNSTYVNYWFLLSSQEYFNRNAQQTVGMASINQEQLGSMPIPILQTLEQHKIVEEIERHFSAAHQIEKTVDHSLKQAERLRQSILKRAFEGKLVPQDPTDELAEKLLERIRQKRARQQAERKPVKSSRNKSNTKQMRLV
jgi:type I restriction enzyme S subunit